MDDASSATVQLHRLDLIALRDLLLSAGWDAIANDFLGEIAARFDRPPGGGVWTLAIDRAGRFQFKSTRTNAVPVETRQRRGDRVYSLALENRQVLTITGRLDSAADVEPILQEIELLVHGREALADHAMTDADSA